MSYINEIREQLALFDYSSDSDFITSGEYEKCLAFLKELEENHKDAVLSAEYRVDARDKVRTGYSVHKKFSDGREEWREFDDVGHEIHVRTSAGFEQWREYDTSGHEIYYSDSDGYEVWREFDDAGHVIHYRTSTGFERWSDYDDVGNEVHFRDSAGFEQWREYDDAGNEIHSRDSKGFEQWREFDDAGNEIHSWNTDSYEEWREFDDAGNEIHFRNSDGDEKWREFDDAGHEVHYRDSDGVEQWHEFDDAGHEIHLRNSDGFEEWREYDNAGNEVHFRNSDGFEEWSEYIFTPVTVLELTEYFKEKAGLDISDVADEIIWRFRSQALPLCWGPSGNLLQYPDNPDERDDYTTILKPSGIMDQMAHWTEDELKTISSSETEEIKKYETLISHFVEFQHKCEETERWQMAVNKWNHEKAGHDGAFHPFKALQTVNPDDPYQISAVKAGFPDVTEEEARSFLSLVNYDDVSFRFMFDPASGVFAEIKVSQNINDGGILFDPASGGYAEIIASESLQNMCSYLENEVAERTGKKDKSFSDTRNISSFMVKAGMFKELSSSEFAEYVNSHGDHLTEDEADSLYRVFEGRDYTPGIFNGKLYGRNFENLLWPETFKDILSVQLDIESGFLKDGSDNHFDEFAGIASRNGFTDIVDFAELDFAPYINDDSIDVWFDEGRLTVGMYLNHGDEFLGNEFKENFDPDKESLMILVTYDENNVPSYTWKIHGQPGNEPYGTIPEDKLGNLKSQLKACADRYMEEHHNKLALEAVKHLLTLSADRDGDEPFVNALISSLLHKADNLKDILLEAASDCSTADYNVLDFVTHEMEDTEVFKNAFRDRSFCSYIMKTAKDSFNTETGFLTSSLETLDILAKNCQMETEALQFEVDLIEKGTWATGTHWKTEVLPELKEKLAVELLADCFTELSASEGSVDEVIESSPDVNVHKAFRYAADDCFLGDNFSMLIRKAKDLPSFREHIADEDFCNEIFEIAKNSFEHERCHEDGGAYGDPEDFYTGALHEFARLAGKEREALQFEIDVLKEDFIHGKVVLEETKLKASRRINEAYEKLIEMEEQESLSKGYVEKRPDGKFVISGDGEAWPDEDECIKWDISPEKYHTVVINAHGTSFEGKDADGNIQHCSAFLFEEEAEHALSLLRNIKAEQFQLIHDMQEFFEDKFCSDGFTGRAHASEMWHYVEEYFPSGSKRANNYVDFDWKIHNAVSRLLYDSIEYSPFYKNYRSGDNEGLEMRYSCNDAIAEKIVSGDITDWETVQKASEDFCRSWIDRDLAGDYRPKDFPELKKDESFCHAAAYFCENYIHAYLPFLEENGSIPDRFWELDEIADPSYMGKAELEMQDREAGLEEYNAKYREYFVLSAAIIDKAIVSAGEKGVDVPPALIEVLGLFHAVIKDIEKIEGVDRYPPLPDFEDVSSRDLDTVRILPDITHTQNEMLDNFWYMMHDDKRDLKDVLEEYDHNFQSCSEPDPDEDAYISLRKKIIDTLGDPERSEKLGLLDAITEEVKGRVKEDPVIQSFRSAVFSFLNEGKDLVIAGCSVIADWKEKEPEKAAAFEKYLESRNCSDADGFRDIISDLMGFSSPAKEKKHTRPEPDDSRSM